MGMTPGSGDDGDFAAPSRSLSLAEPRIACPRCGAHVLALRLAERIFMECPVCELRWSEKIPAHRSDKRTTSASQ
jgi:hypothetical protein